MDTSCSLLMNRSANYDSTDPGFNIPPSDTARIKTFLYYRWSSAQTIEWSYAPDLSLQRIWPLTEDLAYANPTLVNAGMNGFPLGDLYRWWSEDYARWELQQDAENARITQWLETGVDPGTVSVEVLRGDEAPTSHALEQNYPNPFNPSTTIRYSLPNKTAVQLSVFNTLGQLVATLVQGEQEAGYHEVKFDGSKLASEVCLYRLRAGDFAETNRLFLIH